MASSSMNFTFACNRILYTYSHLILINPIFSLATHKLLLFAGTRWRSWLRLCATNQKVAGSIPDDIIKIFHLHNPSGRTGVESVSNRNEYQGYLLGGEGKGGRGVELTTLPPSCDGCL